MSKGGDSSNSASAQTPSQWASALTNASISAWKEADILSFSVAQLQALSPGQISNIQVPWAVPMAVWTAETLNAVPLQYWSQWGTRYLSTTSNGVTSIIPLSQSSNGAVSGKNNWFDDVGRGAAGFAFTPSVVAGISNERIAQIGGGLGRNQSHAPSFATNAGYVSPSDFTAALSAATASGANVVTWHISASQTAYMFASGWADMGADFMGALTYSQLGAIAHPESALGAAQFGYLSANQLMALGQMDWSKVTSAQLNATKISVFRGLQNNVLRALSTQAWIGLDQAHTAVLNAADVQLLPATTIARMNYFGYALTASVGAVLTAAQVASIPSTCWAQISDSQFLNSLSTAALQAIPVSAFASMSDAVVGSLDHVHVAALTANQAQNYPLSKLSDASSAFYQNPNTLNFETFVAQSNVNWALAPASFIKLLTPAQLRLISPSQMAALTPTALSALTRAQTQALSLAQIQALSASQLGAMAYISRRTDVVQQVFGASQLGQLSLSFWGNVDSNFLNALAVSAFQAITTTQLQAIAAGAFANLDQAHVNALTGTQLLALSAEQVGQFSGAYLSIPFLRGVRLAAFKGLVPDQMHRLHDYLFNTVVSNAFDTTDPTLLRNAENQFASLLASILDSDDGREAWLQQSVTLLIQLRWLDATAAANLSASDVTTTYVALNWSWMSGTFLNSISTAVFAQIRASSVAQFNLTALAELNDTHLQALTVTQAAGLSGAQLSSISNLGALSVAVVQSLSATQLAGIHQDWSQISTRFLNNLTARQFMGLPPAQFGQLTAAQLATTAIDWRLISPEQLNALSLSEFGKLCAGADPAILHTTAGVVLGLGGEQLAILAQAATEYSAVQMNTLLNRLFGTFSTEQTNRLVDLMKNDTADQIVLQTGLVALFAKMDGSSTGINTAIQTLVSLRQMQPDWFNVDNLNDVLSVMSTQYTNYLQAYQAGITAQSLYSYAFSAHAIDNLLISMNNSLNVQRMQLAQSIGHILNKWDIDWAFSPRADRASRVGFQTLGQVMYQMRTNFKGLLYEANIDYDTLHPRLQRQINTEFRAVTHMAVGALLANGVDSMQLGMATWQADTMHEFAGTLEQAFKKRFGELSWELNRGLQESTKSIKTAQANSTVLAFANLMVMIGASIGEIGRAVYASDKLPAKERDALIASAALTSIADVAQALQLPMALVMEALVRRYSGQQGMTGEDGVYGNLGGSEAIARRFATGFQTSQAQLLREFRMQHAGVLEPSPARHDITAPRLEFDEDLRVQEAPPRRATSPTVAAEEVVVVADVEPVARAQAPKVQFEEPLEAARRSPVLPLVDEHAGIIPHLLYNDGQGNAIIIVQDVGQRDFRSRFVQFAGTKVRDNATPERGLQVSTANLQNLAREAATDGITIKKALIYNVTSEGYAAKMMRMDEVLFAYQHNLRASTEDAYFVLNNLDYLVVRIAETNPMLQHDAAAWQQQATRIIKDRLGIAATADIDSGNPQHPIADRISAAIQASQQDRLPTSLMEEFVLQGILNSDYMGGPRKGAFAGGLDVVAANNTLTRNIEGLAAKANIRLDERFLSQQVQETVTNLTQKYLTNIAKTEVEQRIFAGEFADIPPLQLSARIGTEFKAVMNSHLEGTTVDTNVPVIKSAIVELMSTELVNRLSVAAENAQLNNPKGLSTVEKIVMLMQSVDTLPDALKGIVYAEPLIRNIFNGLSDAVENDMRAQDVLAGTLLPEVVAERDAEHQAKGRAQVIVDNAIHLFEKLGQPVYTDATKTVFTEAASRVVEATLQRGFSTLVDVAIDSWVRDYLQDARNMIATGQGVDELSADFNRVYTEFVKDELSAISRKWAEGLEASAAYAKPVNARADVADSSVADMHKLTWSTAFQKFWSTVLQDLMQSRGTQIVEKVVVGWATDNAKNFHFAKEGIDYISTATKALVDGTPALQELGYNPLAINKIAGNAVRTLQSQDLLGGRSTLVKELTALAATQSLDRGLASRGGVEEVDGAPLVADIQALVTTKVLAAPKLNPGVLRDGLLRQMLISELAARNITSKLSTATTIRVSDLLPDLLSEVQRISSSIDSMVEQGRFDTALSKWPRGDGTDIPVLLDVADMGIESVARAIDAVFTSNSFGASPQAKAAYQQVGGAMGLLTTQNPKNPDAGNVRFASALLQDVTELVPKIRASVEKEVLARQTQYKIEEIYQRYAAEGRSVTEQEIVTIKQQLASVTKRATTQVFKDYDAALEEFDHLTKVLTNYDATLEEFDHLSPNPPPRTPSPELNLAGNANNNANNDLTQQFAKFVADIVVRITGEAIQAAIENGEVVFIETLLKENIETTLDILRGDTSALTPEERDRTLVPQIKEELLQFAAENQLRVWGSVLDKNITLTMDKLAQALHQEIQAAHADRAEGWVHTERINSVDELRVLWTNGPLHPLANQHTIEQGIVEILHAGVEAMYGEPRIEITFANFLASIIVDNAARFGGRVVDAHVQSMLDVLDKIRDGDAEILQRIRQFANKEGLATTEKGALNKPIRLTPETLAQAIVDNIDAANEAADAEIISLPDMDGLLEEMTNAHIDAQEFVQRFESQLGRGQPAERGAAESLFGLPNLDPASRGSTPPPPAEDVVLRPARVPQEADPNRIIVAEDTDAISENEIAVVKVQLSKLQVAVMGVGMLGFALFSSVIGIAAGLAGILYATQSTNLSWQAKAMVLAMNGVRVLTSGVMLVASGAQIVANVVKGVQVATDATKIANAGFAIGNVIGITTNIAQIGIQAQTIETATDSTSRLIAGLAILDSILQLILNVVGTIALAFGPEGMVVNLITFVIASLLPSAAAITTAVEYRKSYDELIGQGLYKEAEVMYTHWQVAAMDASPIINWTSSIYTEEMKKSQERKMDSAWMDKSAEERLLYSLRSSTTLKDNFDSLRAQMYAGAVALSQPLGNLSQTLTRSTMLMLSQDNLSYFEGDKLATVKLAGTLNYSTNTVSRAPKLIGANVNGQTLSLVFNQDLASLFSQLPSLSSFSVLVNGTAVAVSGLAVLNNVITLSLATAVTAGQSVTFSYSDPTAGNDSKAVQNVLGVDAASIVNRSVVNLLDSDKRAPQLADAVAQDNFVTLVFDETLSTAVGKIPVRGAFSVLVNGSAVGIYDLSVHDQRVLLSLNSPIAVGATVTVSYNANYGDGALQDAAGNLVASLNAQRVDNTAATSTVTASRVGWLQYDNFVSSVQGTGTESASVLNGSDYTVYANAADATNGTSRLRYLSLSNAAGEFDMLSVTRAVENNDRIWLDASNAQGVNNFAINTHDMTVWGGQGKNSYSLARPYAAQSYIVAANAWSDKNNVISISGSASDTSKKVNLDYFLSADNISAGLPVTQTAFTVLGANDGLDVVVGSGDNQSYMATSNVANINLTGANANVSVGESAQVNVGINGRVLVDMDMWRGLNVAAPTAGAVSGIIKGNYGSYSLLNFTPTDSINTNFNGKLNLSYQIGHLPRLDAFSVYVGSTLVGVNSLSVNGKTLTLNLSSAVAQNEVVSVSYADASSADDDNTLQGLTGKDVNSFSRQAVVNTTADTTAPKLAVATVQGNSLIVHFSEALQQSYRPLNSAWAVYVNGTRVAVTRVAFNDSSSLRLTLASAVAAGQTVSLNYSAASDTSVAVQDLAGNVTSSFSSASVINLANVTQAPNLRTVTANGNVLTLTFDGTVRYSLSNPSAFVVTANNTPLNISGVSVAGNSVLLYLSSAVSSGQLVEVSYNAPQQVSDATTLRDWLGNTVGSISAQVANNITGQDLTPPSLQYAVANGTSLVLTFSEVLNNQAGFTPLPSGFAVNVNGKAANVTQALVSGSTVTLTLATAANYGDTMTLSYSDLSAGNDAAVVQDVAGNDAASFANVHVINNTPDTTPPSLLSATVNGNQLSLLFSESLNASSGYLPALTSMVVTVNGVAVSISAGSVIGDTATLTLGTAVNAGDYVNFNYTAPSGNTLQAFQDGAGNDVLSIANFNVTNSTGLDVTPPSLVSAQVNGSVLTLTFSEALASTASFTPGASAFTVSVDGNSATVSGVRLNGTQAVLTLASAVDSTAKVTVGYVRPSSQAIQDGAQNMAASFGAQSVSNVTADTTPPSLSSASVAGAVLTLTFSENLATTPALLASASEFAVTVDGQVVDVLSAVSSGNSVSITLSKAVTASQKVSVDYTASTSGTNYLQDVANNKTANFSRTVQNSSGLASIQNATVNGTTLSLIFNQELDANSTHLPPLSAFAVKVNGVSSAVSNLAVNGHVVTLTLGAAVTAGQKVTVNYTDPSTDNDLAALQNRGGLDVQSFSAPYAVHNLSVAPEAATPSLSNAKVNGSTLTLTFSEALDAGVGEWWVNYLPDGQYDASGNPVVTSRVKASGFVNVLGSNNNDSFIIGDQSGLESARQLGYVQLGNGQGVQVNYYDTSGNLFLAMGNKGQANVILESGSSLQKLLTAKLVQGDADIANYKANRDTVTLKSLSSLTAFLSGYETIDATDSTSRLMAEIGEGDHQIKLGGQTVHLEFDKAVSNTSISTRQIPNSWLDYQYFNFKDMNADGLWVGRESDGTVLFRAQWKDSASGGTDNKLNVSYDGTLSNVVFEVGNVVSGSKTSQLRLDKLIEAMSNPAFSTDPNAASHAMTDADTATKLYRITDIVAYSAASQPTVTGGV